MASETTHSQRFVAEAREHLAGMTEGLLALERGEAQPQPVLESVLRCAHSVKGGAGFTGYKRIEQLAHAMETLIEEIRDGRAPLTPEIVDRLLAGLDRISAMVDDPGHSESIEIADLLDRLSIAANRGAAIASTELQSRSSAQPTEFPLSQQVLAASEHAEFLYGVKFDWFECERQCGLSPLDVTARLNAAGDILDSRLDVTGPPIGEGLPVAPLLYRAIVASTHDPDGFTGALRIPCAGIVRLERIENAPPPHRSPPETPRAASPGSLRIPISLIDRMMALAGELVLVRNQAMQAGAADRLATRQLVRRLNSVTNELQDAALRMRMQPVATLFDRFPRLVRDVARQLGKQIEVEIRGAEVELDKSILELLSDPLTHLVRNCCDHGVEGPDERARAGKNPVGVIRLSAAQKRGRILIEIRDDGRGLDRDAIRQKAVQRGLRRSDELDLLSDRQVYELILLSGFSTAERVTDLSGRGVGMDVVKTNLEQIGGVLEIDSAPQRGTCFTLSLPLTLAIVPCLLLRNGGQRFALPLRDIEEIVLLGSEARAARVECTHDQEVLRLRGRLLPVVRLGEVLARRQRFNVQTWSEIVARHHSESAAANGYVAVLRVGSQRFGLLIEDLLGSEEIVVKPLHPILRPLGAYAGATILGDGQVALILSAEGIARHTGVGGRAVISDAPLLSPPPETEQETLLLFRCGPDELLALPLAGVQRVVQIRADRIERVGGRELIHIDGAALGLIRLDALLNLSACPDRDTYYAIIPRGIAAAALLASEVVDTPTLSVKLDQQAVRMDGLRGSVLIGDRVSLLLDPHRIAEMRDRPPAERRALPRASKRILVVDDTAFFRQLVRSHLESVGYDVTVASHGAEGLELASSRVFDLVVSDVEMPVMDGLTFARRVRENSTLTGLPLLALTTLSAESDRQRALESGFSAYEVKLDREQFLATVHRLLSGTEPTSITSGGGAR